MISCGTIRRKMSDESEKGKIIFEHISYVPNKKHHIMLAIFPNELIICSINPETKKSTTLKSFELGTPYVVAINYYQSIINKLMKE